LDTDYTDIHRFKSFKFSFKHAFKRTFNFGHELHGLHGFLKKKNIFNPWNLRNPCLKTIKNIDTILWIDYLSSYLSSEGDS